MSTRRRSRPILRLALIAAGIGLLLIVGGIVSYAAFRSSRSVPLDVALFPDAELVSTEIVSEGHHDLLLYRSESPPEEVAAFYWRELSDSCVLIENPTPGAEPAFQQRCIADGSSFFLTQYTIVTVQPGLIEGVGRTIIHIERVWGE